MYGFVYDGMRCDLGRSDQAPLRLSKAVHLCALQPEWLPVTIWGAIRAAPDESWAYEIQNDSLADLKDCIVVIRATLRVSGDKVGVELCPAAAEPISITPSL
jgi:hypothetical protein